MPFNSQDANDKPARALAIAQLRVDCGLTVKNITEAMGCRARWSCSIAGLTAYTAAQVFSVLASCVGEPRVEPPLTPTPKCRRRRFWSARKVAARLGIAVVTPTENIRAGVVGKECSQTGGCGEKKVADRFGRDVRDQNTLMGRAATDVAGRVLASAASFASRHCRNLTSRLRELCAVPMQLRERILPAPLQLPSGYYSGSSVVMFLALMNMAQVANPEQLRYDAPGKWGRILGLDHCPEVKTLHGKLALLSRGWQTIATARRHCWLTDT